jgi:antitoxin component YwqK of YwqJK toxin-antitoxin module
MYDIYKNDQRNGLSVKNDPDGTLSYSMRYEDGDAMGFTYLGGDGKLLPEISSVQGVIQMKSFFPNGKISRQAVYIDGKVNGRDILFYTNGQVRSVDSADYGVREGMDKEYYTNGKIMLDYNYLHDNLHGICRQYSEKGVLLKETSYWNGLPHGLTKYFSEDGKPIETRQYYYGKLISVKNEK